MKKMFVAFGIAITLFVSAFCVTSAIHEYDRMCDTHAARYAKYNEELAENEAEFDRMTRELLAEYSYE